VNPAKWFLTVALYTALTLVCIYVIPSGSPLSVLTFFFGFTYVAFVPGYCLITLLFEENKLDLIEQTVLSVALSFGIAGVSGLFLGLSPILISVQSITVTLTGIVLVLAFLTMLKKMGLMQKLHLRSPAQKLAVEA
jgi:uncharacterized membrane protein